MSLYDHHPRLADRFLTRRQLLSRLGMGFGAMIDMVSWVVISK